MRQFPLLFVWIFIISLAILSVDVDGEEYRKHISKRMKTDLPALKLIREESIDDSFSASSPYAQLVGKKLIPKKFEASDVVMNDDGSMIYVVFDNTYHLGAFCTSKTSRLNGCVDQLIEWSNPTVQKAISEFEGIARNYLNGTYFVAQETISSSSNGNQYQPNIFQIEIKLKDPKKQLLKMEIIESCRVNVMFQSDSKGFEGLEFVVHRQRGKSYLLGLCEANQCANQLNRDKDQQRGFGRLILLEKRMKNALCSWEPIGTIPLPSSVHFLDYSAISISRDSPINSIAITSQEDSQVWIGQIIEMSSSPFFKVSPLTNSSNQIYEFPRLKISKNEMKTEYCNIEGVTWMNKNQLIFVSDEAKKDQFSSCSNKDQRIHYFSLI